MALEINGARLWESLEASGEIGAIEGGGLRRLSLSAEDRQIRDVFSEWVKAEGCALDIDELGNMFARRSGTDNDLAPVAIGSHLDTQIYGGRYDGILGVLGGLECLRILNEQGIENAHGQHIGGGYHHPFGYVKLTIAHHGSRFPDGSDGGNPCGFLITVGDKKLYFACDTGLFESMRLYGEEGIDFAALPIGDNYTMGPDDALRAVKLLTPKTVVPVHYNTWSRIAQDADAWAKRVEADTDSKCEVMQVGDSIAV